MKSTTIAEARQHLPALVHEVERSGALQLTRRGRPVAVLISQEQYEHFQGAQKPDLWEAILRFRSASDFSDEGLTESDFAGLREADADRPFDWPE